MNRKEIIKETNPAILSVVKQFIYGLKNEEKLILHKKLYDNLLPISSTVSSEILNTLNFYKVINYKDFNIRVTYDKNLNDFSSKIVILNEILRGKVKKVSIDTARLSFIIFSKTYFKDYYSGEKKVTPNPMAYGFKFGYIFTVIGMVIMFLLSLAFLDFETMIIMYAFRIVGILSLASKEE